MTIRCHVLARNSIIRVLHCHTVHLIRTRVHIKVMRTNASSRMAQELSQYAEKHKLFMQSLSSSALQPLVSLGFLAVV
jgi:hypothetical protein